MNVEETYPSSLQLARAHAMRPHANLNIVWRIKLELKLTLPRLMRLTRGACVLPSSAEVADCLVLMSLFSGAYMILLRLMSVVVVAYVVGVHVALWCL